MKVGVLAIQGDFKEHKDVLVLLGANVTEVRKVSDLENITGLIIPGGESTTMGKFLREEGLRNALIEKGFAGFPMWGTCAGAILLAKEVMGADEPHIGLLDITIERNAYGRQLESFIDDVELLNIMNDKEHFAEGVFIRAPKITRVCKNVDVLARYKNEPVMVKQGNVLASTFHPELTSTHIFHKYFLDILLAN